MTIAPGGLRIRIARRKTDPAGEGTEISLPRGKHAKTCSVRGSETAYSLIECGPKNAMISGCYK